MSVSVRAMDTFSLADKTVVLYLQLYVFIVAGDIESAGGGEECAGFNKCQVSAQSQSDSLHLLFIRYVCYYANNEMFPFPPYQFMLISNFNFHLW